MEKITIHNYEAFLLDYMEGNLSEAGLAELQVFALTHPELEIDLDVALPYFEKEELSFDLKNDLKKTEADAVAELLINYVEGNLTEAQRLELETKLATDTDLAAELELFKKTILPLEATIFENKNQLYKTEDDVVLNNRVLAYFENQLDATAKAAFEAELENDAALQTELALISKTKLAADAALIYPNKPELKKEGRVIALFSRRNMAAMAAALLLLLGLGLLFTYYNQQGNAITPALAKHNTMPQSQEHKQPASEAAQTPAPALLAKQAPSAPVNNSQPINSRQPKRSTTVVGLPQNNLAQQQLVSPVNNQNTFENKQQVTQEALATDHKNKSTPVETPFKKETTEQNALANNAQKPVNQNAVNAARPDSTQVEMAAMTQLDEETEGDATAPAKKGFWHRAVKLAQRANHLGITAVDGEENNSAHKYALSFNSFSVEKH